MRNFWIEAFIDGRKEVLRGGPRSRDGEMRVCIYSRNEGESEKVLEIHCYPDGDKLVTAVSPDPPINGFWTRRWSHK